MSCRHSIGGNLLISAINLRQSAKLVAYAKVCFLLSNLRFLSQIGKREPDGLQVFGGCMGALWFCCCCAPTLLECTLQLFPIPTAEWHSGAFSSCRPAFGIAWLFAGLAVKPVASGVRCFVRPLVAHQTAKFLWCMPFDGPFAFGWFLCP